LCWQMKSSKISQVALLGHAILVELRAEHGRISSLICRVNIMILAGSIEISGSGSQTETTAQG